MSSEWTFELIVCKDYDMPEIPTLAVGTKTVVQDRDLTDDELLLTSPIVYGFSLMDKIWRECSLIRDFIL